LVIWVAMSDLAKSTATCKVHTTLHGLSNKFASLYGIDYSNPLSSEDVLAIFRSRGITGNPILIMDTNEKMAPNKSIIEHAGRLFAEQHAASLLITEESQPPEKNSKKNCA